MSVPDYFVMAEGSSIMGAVSTRLIALTVTDKAGLSADTFDLLLDDKGDRIEPPRKGAKLKIWIGYRPDGSNLFQSSNGLVYMGEYVVDEVEVSLAPRHLRITGKGADLRDSLKSQKTRAFDDKPTLKKIFEKIAKDHKLEAKVDEEIGKIELPDFVQTEESDLHLATRLAAQYGAIVKYADGKMIVSKRGSGASAGGKAMKTIIVRLEDVKNARGRLKDRERYGSATAAWHDQAKAKRVIVKEEKGEGPNYELRPTYRTEAEARDACKAKLAEMQRREADLSYMTQGDPDLCAEAKLQLQGVSRKLDGEWIITQARHILRGSPPGYETQVEAQTPGQRKDEKGGKGGK